MKILRNRKIINFLLLFIPILEGLFVITTLLSTQSDPKNVIFLGFSASRLVLISFSLLLTALFTFSLINSKLNNKIVDWLYSSSKLQTRIKQYGLIILMLLYLTLYISEDYFGIFAASFVRLRPLIIWLELIFLQLFLSLKYISRENIFINKNSKLVSVVITKLDRFLEVNFFVPKMLIPLGVLLLYSGSYAYIFSRFLVETVNGFFATRLFYITLIFTLGISIIFLVRYISRSHAKLSFDQSAEKITYSNLLLILLPLTPVVQYILNNQDILSPIESLAILVLFAIIAVLYIIFVPLIFRNVSSTHLLMIIGLTFIFTINTMALLSQQFSWFQKGNFLIQLIFFYLVFLLSWLLFNLKDKKVFRLIIVMFFLINSFTQLLSFNKNAEKPSNTLQKNNLESLVVDRSPVDKPNIYLLVYDAYVVNETMLAYGIDNSAQEAFLIDQGFKLYPSTYSVGAASIETMSRVLNASTDFYGDSRRAVSGDGIVQNLLKNLGYTTYGIFPYSYYFLGIGSSYDYSFPKESTAIKQVVSGILIGEFRFDLGFDYQSREEFSRTKSSYFESVSTDPVFIYTHSDRPEHSQNSGACLQDEIERYQGRLTDANLEMKQDIELITRNDPEAIIVVAGDHGPYLTKNCISTAYIYDISEITRLDIQDRFGTFLAIRWPTKDFSEYDDITILQDLFPAIFAYLYRDASILDSKIVPDILVNAPISWATVKDGIIYGGINDKEPLFLLSK